MVARSVAAVLMGAAGCMLACAGLAMVFELWGTERRPIDHGSGRAMVLSAAITGAFAAFAWWWGRGVAPRPLRRSEATVAVGLIWFGISVLGGLPFVLGAGLGPVDAVFEASSGFTTTGATAISDVEGRLSHAVLLWRSMIQWLGGMGVVVLFVAVFPNLGVTGKHLFRSEVPGVSPEGLQPRITETSMILWRLYAALTLAETGCLWLCGMSLFEATNHAMTTMSTGGFSTRNDSVAGFENAAVDYVISFFMLVAAANFGLYALALEGRSLRVLARNQELRLYLSVVVISILLVALSIVHLHDGSWAEAFRVAVFAVATTISSCGFVTSDYMAFPAPALAIVLGLMVLGGCTGSTAGGLKVERLGILVETARAELRRNVRPRVVHVVRMDHRVIPQEVQLEVTTFFFVYLACLGVGTVLVTYTDGVPVQTALGAMLTCVSNMGPAPFHVGADDFASYSSAAKIVFALAMIMGRLELYTVLSLLLPETWRR